MLSLVQNKLPKFPHETKVHPITGITHTPVDDGYDPPIYSYPNDDLTRFKSMVVHVPLEPQERVNFLSQMPDIAQAMSEMTGQNVMWYYVKDSCCNVFGDYGWFIVDRK